MTRSRSSAKAAGTRFESQQARFLAEALQSDHIERRAKSGARDRGDIAGVRHPGGGRVVIECKDTAKLDLPGWLREAERERLNDGAEFGVAMFKKRGTAVPGEQYVVMDAATFARLLGGAIPAPAGEPEPLPEALPGLEL